MIKTPRAQTLNDQGSKWDITGTVTGTASQQDSQQITTRNLQTLTPTSPEVRNFVKTVSERSICVSYFRL